MNATNFEGKHSIFSLARNLDLKKKIPQVGVGLFGRGKRTGQGNGMIIINAHGTYASNQETHHCILLVYAGEI